jgi:hypothetical protein
MATEMQANPNDETQKSDPNEKLRILFSDALSRQAVQPMKHPAIPEDLQRVFQKPD